LIGASYELRKSIPATMVKEYLWCPAIPWIIHNYGAQPELTPSMERGLEFRKSRNLEEVANRFSLPTPRRYEVFVASKKLGAHGYIDIVAGSKHLVVAEVKAFKTKRWQHFKAQLLTYAAIANAEIAPVRKAMLILGTKAIEIEVTQQDLEWIKRTIDKIKKVIESPEPPPVNPIPNKCRYCTYRKHCPITT